MVTIDCTIALCITLLERHLLLLKHTKTQRQKNNLQISICWKLIQFTTLNIHKLVTQGIFNAFNIYLFL